MPGGLASPYAYFGKPLRAGTHLFYDAIGR